MYVPKTWSINFLDSHFSWQVLKHKVDGIRRICSHPLLPLCEYLTALRFYIVFIILFLCRFDRWSGRFRAIVGMGPLPAGGHSAPARHLRQGHQGALLSARQQVWRGRFGWEPKFVAGRAFGKCHAAVLRKYLLSHIFIVTWMTWEGKGIENGQKIREKSGNFGRNCDSQGIWNAYRMSSITCKNI